MVDDVRNCKEEKKKSQGFAGGWWLLFAPERESDIPMAYAVGEIWPQREGYMNHRFPACPLLAKACPAVLVCGASDVPVYADEPLSSLEIGGRKKRGVTA